MGLLGCILDPIGAPRGAPREGGVRRRHVSGILLLALLASLPAFPQTTNTGTVLGLVTDPAEAAVPGATVQLQDTATGVVRSVTTNIAGRYVFVGVPPGTYSVKVTAPGFQQAVVPAVVVEVGKSYAVDVQLSVGETRQTIEITASGAELQTLDSTIGTTIGGDALLLPPTLNSASPPATLPPASAARPAARPCW